MKDSNRDFYISLESGFREGSLLWNSYYINLHFLDFSIDFCREFRHLIDLREVYLNFRGSGNLWILKQDKRRFREFFGESDYD